MHCHRQVQENLTDWVVVQNRAPLVYDQQYYPDSEIMGLCKKYEPDWNWLSMKPTEEKYQLCQPFAFRYCNRPCKAFHFRCHVRQKLCRYTVTTLERDQFLDHDPAEVSNTITSVPGGTVVEEETGLSPREQDRYDTVLHRRSIQSAHHALSKRYEFPNKRGKLRPLYVQIYHKGHRFANCYDSSNSIDATNYMVELERGVRFNELTKLFFWELEVPGGKKDTVQNRLNEDSLALLEPGVAYKMEDSTLELRASDLKYMLMTITRVTCFIDQRTSGITASPK